MKQSQKFSILGNISLVTAHILALILISWYTLIQVGVVQYDWADMFGAILLLSHPIAGMMLLLQLFEQISQPNWNRTLIWGCVLSSSIAIVSGVAWIQLILFFSSLGGASLGST